MASSSMSTKCGSDLRSFSSAALHKRSNGSSAMPPLLQSRRHGAEVGHVVFGEDYAPLPDVPAVLPDEELKQQPGQLGINVVDAASSACTQRIRQRLQRQQGAEYVWQRIVGIDGGLPGMGREPLSHGLLQRLSQPVEELSVNIDLPRGGHGDEELLRLPLLAQDQSNHRMRHPAQLAVEGPLQIKGSET
eukprot:CAMPEP_0179161904 /NCGR_PEP_ID=MMETSP0796-20121207/79281_1 /TAXON_ID=73915 /ORGANISM="Pyrodinium bahamense, Strain pbaha01" /LENGTH=189 /DNA_ID=CAMNT_0020864051 /DNA_START=89 /DNA_END=655 /DNA_ORIENTATION=+